MKTTGNEQVGTILDNQKVLMDTLMKNANAILDLYRVKEVPGTQVLEEYQKETQAYLKTVLKPENSGKLIEQMPQNLSKAIEIQTNLYKASFDYAVNIWNRFDTKAIQKRFDVANKLYQDSTTAIIETTNKNMEVLTTK